MDKTLGFAYVAGSLTTDDWKNFRPTLKPGGDPAVWKKTFEDYFFTRLSLRYLEPIKVLQDNGTFQGEGFSIASIQCSIVEFLESTMQGISYRFRARGAPQLGPHEYSNSSDIFVSFLTRRTPFKNDFKDENTAQDFYEGVRCGLLHEARTKNGWIIWAKHDTQIIDAKQKILYRDNFQASLLTFVEWYGGQLQSDRALQEAFLRKFDSLCM